MRAVPAGRGPVTPVTRAQDVNDARAAADQWAAERGLPPSGGYSGRSYIDGYLFGWWPDWHTWLADYGKPAGALLGGNVVGHQYTSTPVDMSVFEDSEVIADVTDDERQQYEDKINGLVSALGLLCGDDLKPLTRKNAAAYVRTYVEQARALAEQFGVQHA